MAGTDILDPQAKAAADSLALAWDKVHYQNLSRQLVDTHCDGLGDSTAFSPAAEHNLELAMAKADTKRAEELNPTLHAEIDRANNALKAAIPDPYPLLKVQVSLAVEHVFNPIRAGIAQGRAACSQGRQFRP